MTAGVSSTAFLSSREAATVAMMKQDLRKYFTGYIVEKFAHIHGGGGVCRAIECCQLNWALSETYRLSGQSFKGPCGRVLFIGFSFCF